MTQHGEITDYLTVPRAHGPAWSPDGTMLAFLSDITGIDQVWLLLVTEKSEPRQLTHFSDRVGMVAWSPDNEHLIATVDAGGNEHDQLYLLARQATEPEALTQAPAVIHHFGAWSPDGSALCYSSNQRHPAFFDVWIMDIQTKTARCILQQEASFHPNAWSPNGKSLLVTRQNSGFDLDLFLLPLDGSPMQHLTFHEGEAAYEYPRFTSDSQALYVLTNYQREFMAPASIDLSAAILPHVHAPLTYLADTSWDAEAGMTTSPAGTTLAWALNENGRSRLVFYDVEQKQEQAAPELPIGVIEGLTWSPTTNQLAFSFNGTAHAGNIWLVQTETARAQQITTLPTRIQTDELITPELIHYPSFDGLQIPAYYYRPHTTTRATADGLLPVILFVHGGPESQFRPLHAAPWMPPLQYYLHRGFAVLAPNVRGSSGYGKKYVHLDDVGLRADSVADLKAAVDWLKQEGHADPQRIGIVGRSYGGYMVLAAITTYPDLWAAAVDIVGIANFVSFLEQTGPWRRKWREAEYGSLEYDREILTRLSPIHAVERIIAPLLVLHGANDSRVPVAEADHIVAAVHARGIPVEYLRFPDEGHFMMRQSTQLKAYPAIGDWFEQYMG
ncbi:MAG TPA: S9 family peptidase [Ktedonobacteraceae bacterium]